MSYKTILVMLTILAFSIPTYAENQEKDDKSKIYLLKNSKCRYRKKDRITYCTDLKNTPLTGDIRLYEDGEVIRSIPVEKGLIHGTVKSFEVNGDKRYTKEYKNGRIHGQEETFYPQNKTEKIIPYVNGYKEGLAKEFYPNGILKKQYTYVEDTLDGQLRTYTEEGKVLYDVITANNKYVEAKCSFLDENNNISQKEVPTILLEAINNGCATLGEQLKTHCSISLSSELETCNLNWLKENEENLKNLH